MFLFIFWKAEKNIWFSFNDKINKITKILNRKTVSMIFKCFQFF